MEDREGEREGGSKWKIGRERVCVCLYERKRERGKRGEAREKKQMSMYYIY